MMYVRVLVADSTFHGKEALTYAADEQLPIGKIVLVPLKAKKVLGIVVGSDKKPIFKVRPILDIPNLDCLPLPLVKLLEWIPTYYPAPLGVITQHFASHKKIRPLREVESSSDYPALPELTADQKAALARIQNVGLHVLHGETGSGKTRVYIELAKKALQKGRSATILSPEIGLTSQIAHNFFEVFGKENVIVFHSQLSPARRQEAWSRILSSNKPLVIVGARSALFLPLKNLGLIVVDESHETAYKQDSAPYYHANTVAAKLGALHQATVVLGSATPSVVDYFVAQTKQRPIIYLGETAKKLSSVSISIVDRRDKHRFTKTPYLSDDLLAGIRRALSNKEQSLIFLNRRGTARVVLCEQCGWQSLCPHCDLPLTYHADSHKVICHSCGFRQTSPSNCPDCGNASVLFKSIGTKSVVEQLAKFFPEATIQRFDTDNSKAERLEAHFDTVKAGKVDILVGTQTLAKGLDLPLLGFVGVIDAETSLSFPDFSATERSYQLLSQVLGRIGRGHRAAYAVIQTYSPTSFVLRTAIEKSWKAFYEKELEERKLFNFPPFCYLLKITCKRSSTIVAQKAAQKLCQSLRNFLPRVVIDGPAPCFHEKQNNQYQWQIVVKSKSRNTLLQIIDGLPANFSYDIDPVNLL